jgi:uncharacterized protein involved in type VI secretion and phage assembly
MIDPPNLGGISDEQTRPRKSGDAVASVTDNEDPEKLGRVKVTYPWRDSDDDSYWARVATPMGGKEYGAYFLPEVGDEVLVAFQDGDIHHPFVVGSLWTGKQKPPEDNASGNNDVRTIKSRKGHRLEFDDAKQEAKTTIETAAGHKIVLDDKSGSEKITIEDKSGNNAVEMDSTKGEVSISAGTKISLSAPTIELAATSEVNASAKGKMNLESKGKMNVDSKGQLNLTGSGLAKLKSSGILQVKGSLVQIN